MRTIKACAAGTIVAIAALLGSDRPASASNAALPISYVAASSHQTGYEPAKAVDRVYDNAANRWAANAAPSAASPQWISFDLGSLKYAGAIEIFPEIGSGPKDFTVETSADGVSYTVQRTVHLTADKRTYSSWTPLKAQYIRIKATAGFGGKMQIREAYLFSEIYPYRVGTLAAGDPYDFSRLTEAGFDALKKANVQLVNMALGGYAPDYAAQILPNGGDPDVDANYDWAKADETVGRFASHGFDMAFGQNIGLTTTAWPQLSDPMVDEHGNAFDTSIRGNPFASDYLTLSKAFVKKVAAHFADNPYVRSHLLTGPGFFGGMEIFGGDIVNPSLYVYDDNAKARFREWLQTHYASLAALNSAWGTAYASWSGVQPPLPLRTGMTGAYDARQSWSDLMFWLRDYIVQFAQQTASDVRSVTDKPLSVEIDGTNLFSPMESQASVGLVARAFGDYKPFVLAGSSSDEVFGSAALAAAARFYGYDTAMDNANYESAEISDDTMFGLMSKGIGTFNNSNLAEDFIGSGWVGAPHTTGWDPSASYTPTQELNQFAEKTKRLLAVDPLPAQSDVAVYNSFYSSNYRKGYRYDDYMNIYDKDHGVGFNVRPFASWSHYIDSPDIVDDFLIEDGALSNYKLLVTANASLTLTSDTAQGNLLSWIHGGGAIVGFGKDSFNYKLNLSTRSISGGTNVSDWMMGLSGGAAATTTASRTASVAANKPDWLTSLKPGETATFAVEDVSQAQAFTSLVSGATPVLVDGSGRTIMAEYDYGAGKVLFSTIPVSDSELFHDEFMGKILHDFADHAGIVREVAYDGDRFHAAYMGTNKLDDSKVVVVADPKYMAGGQYSANGEVADPQYQGNGQTMTIKTGAGLNGQAVTLDVTTPWNHVSGGTIRETSFNTPQKLVTFTAFSSQPLTLQALPYGYLPIAGVTAGMSEKPYTPDRVADGLKEDSGYWLGGGASAANPQVLTVDLGKVYPVAGMELYPYADADENELFSFEDGRYDGWTVTGAAFGTAPSSGTHGGLVTNVKGKFWADSKWGDDSITGKLRSPNFMIDKDLLSLRIAGYDGPAGTNQQNYIMIKRASDNTPLYVVRPPQSDALVTRQLDVQAWIGTEAYLEATDADVDAAYGWIGFDSVSLSNYKDKGAVADFSFEQGTFAGWSASGAAFGSAPSSADHGGLATGWRGVYWADSLLGGQAATGTLTSRPFIPKKELLTFRMAGFDGTSGAEGKNFVYLRRASDDAILLTAKPPQSGSFKLVTWDVSAYMGTSVYMQVVDGNGGGADAWLGIDDVQYSADLGFERGTYAGWTVTGTGFGLSPTYQKTDPTRPWGKSVASVPGYNGKYFASTHAAGSTATGILTSRSFVVDKPILSFRGAGYDGPGGSNNQNYYWLMRASDNTPLIVGKPPQSDHFTTTYWDVSAYIGEEVYFKVEDTDASDGSAGWIAFDDLQLLNNFDFEIGTWAGWTTTGTAFGSFPLLYDPNGSVSGFRGSRYAASYLNGNTPTGTLTSERFTLESGTFSFRKAGYDGPTGTNDQNFYYLRRASDDAILFSAKPPQDDSFVTETWDVSAYIGTKVYFQAVDGASDSWLAVDDIQWRGAGPKAFTVQVSSDGTTWSAPVLAVADQGNRFGSYSWTPASGRYIRLSITEGYGDQVAIKELAFRQALTELPIAAAIASSEGAGYEAGKAMDGIVDSDSNMWASVGAAPNWIRFDLGAVKSVGAVEVFARNSAFAQKLGPADFSVQVSADGISWTTVYIAKNNGENDTTYTFPAASARYVKLDIASGWNGTSQIREVKIFE
ncbi:discoidin domain-containing protein [Cohnella sp. GCM10012308]|uniref:discoidin domain-containing protein n=1 Tax=Cohnella sp. GCM10012308 TaxID=3317329 RepID=UPI00361315A3